MASLETVLSRKEAEDCANWILSEIAHRIPSKHQEAPLLADHISRRIPPKYLRRSDLSERVYASAEVLERAGYTQKGALPIIADRLQTRLGKSKRGRPGADAAKRDFFSKMQTVRSMITAFGKRLQYAESVVEWWLGQFVWLKSVGAIRGSEYNPDFGRKMHQARLEMREALRRLGVVW